MREKGGCGLDWINTAPFVGVGVGGGLRVCVYIRRCTGGEVHLICVVTSSYTTISIQLSLPLPLQGQRARWRGRTHTGVTSLVQNVDRDKLCGVYTYQLYI